MYIYIFMIYYFLNTSFATDLLSTLWEEEDEEVLVFRSLKGEPLPKEKNKLIIRRLSELPFTDQLKSNAWHRIVRYRHVKSMDVKDWETYEPLLPYLPPSLLLDVNLSDPVILTYFGRQELKESQLSQLAEEVTDRVGGILSNKKLILMLGNIFCGFSPEVLSKIEESVLRQNHLVILLKLLRDYKILGPPRTWNIQTVQTAGILVAGLDAQELRQIRGDSFSEILPNIIDLIPVENLRELRSQQLKYFKKPTLLSWRRKTRDLRALNECFYQKPNILFVSLVIAFVLLR